MVIVERFGPRPVALGVLTWAIVVDICFFVARTAHHAGISGGTATAAYWFAALVTVAAGTWLGWRHRTGTAFVAPAVAWVLVVPFAFASEFLRVGFLGGLWRGLLLAIVGGFVAAFVEGVLLVAFAVLGRIAGGFLDHADASRTVILPPRSG